MLELRVVLDALDTFSARYLRARDFLEVDHKLE